jgi:hypothetical protein
LKIELNERRRAVRVESDGCLIFDLKDFPASALKVQLRAWLQSADDASPMSFVFSSENPDWRGAFRIESRLEGWQFTSWKERVRTSELLSLEAWQNVLRQSGV